jgi:hypothetical protein
MLGVEPTFSSRVLTGGQLLSLLSSALVAILPAMLLGRIGSGDALRADARAGRPAHDGLTGCGRRWWCSSWPSRWCCSSAPA